MKKALLFTVLLLVVGCTKKGDKGDTGIQGLRGNQGPGQIVPLSGTVTSDTFTVTDPRIALASNVNAYIFLSPSFVQLPVYNIGGGYNVLYTINQNGSITIYNALKGGATLYEIVLII